MKTLFLKINLAGLLCLGAFQNTNAAANLSKSVCNNIVSKHFNCSYLPLKRIDSRFISDTPKISRTINSMPMQSRDTGNYGLHMQLSKDSLTYAQTGIYFYANASDTYVQNEDAAVINGGTPQVYLSSYTSDNVQVCINTLSDYAKGKRVRLYVNAVCSGIYTLSLADIFGMDTASYSVFLIDIVKQDSVNIVHTKAYQFSISLPDTTSFGAKRFVLAIEHNQVGPCVLSAFSGQKASEGIQINWKAINAGNYTGYILQRLTMNGSFDSLYAVQSADSITAYHFTDTHPIIGNNVYRLEQIGITGAVTYSDKITIGYNSSAPNSTLNLYPNPAKNMMTVSMASSTTAPSTYIADIYNLSGQRIKHAITSGTTWTNDVSAYKSGYYIVQITDTNGNLVGRTKFMKGN